ncbi:MAG: recombinase RecT [Acinetobacter sp.]|uniref:RecT family recombinase n=1 Tax=Acinetobacter sp. TaxID=472 RepID=UPI000F9481F6|nr:RecT family recombinase [Acinetobacter sp.]RUP38241.1 MAG: recombinase RecT [Acinetobacter sp.]
MEGKPNAEKLEKTISDSVLTRVAEFEKAKAIQLPDNYSAANALKFAYLILSQAVDKDKRKVLEVCTMGSIANALLEMVIQGLNPMKKQCYFIAMGSELVMMRSYQGSIAVAKRVAGVQSINSQVVYEGDVLIYEIGKDGVKRLIKHEQAIENINNAKIRGAYAIAVTKEGDCVLEIMNKDQIFSAWKMGAGGGGTKAHTNFNDEMSKKTVVNRLCKTIINSSDDASLFTEEKEIPADKIEKAVAIEVQENANMENISFEMVQDSKSNEQPEQTSSIEAAGGENTIQFPEQNAKVEVTVTKATESEGRKRDF